MSPLAWPGIKVEGEEKGFTSAQAFVLLGSKTFYQYEAGKLELKKLEQF